MNTHIESRMNFGEKPEATKTSKRILRGIGLTAAVAVLGTSAYGAISEVKEEHTPATSDTYKEYTVAPGDTLWEIAKSAAPDVDPRTEVDKLREQLPNHSAELVPGETLRLPASSELGEPAPSPLDNSGN